MTAIQERAPEDRAKRRAFVVVGMHRSGTSAMTRTLSLLGAALPKRLMVAHEDNPAGFWEPQSVADLNDEILQALDSEWDDVFSFRPRHYLSNFDRFYIGRAVEVLEQEFNGSEVIVLKDPRISVLTSFWDRALQEAGYATHYVVMVRNPLEVAESLRMRDSFPREKSLLLWSSYMIAVDRDTRETKRTFLSYEQLMSDWRAVRDRIQEDTGVPFPRDTAAAAIEIDRFLDNRLRHHQAASEDLSSRADVPDEVKVLYRIFSNACEGEEVDSSAVEAVQAELEKIESFVGPVLADLKSRTRSLAENVAELHQANAGACERAETLVEQLGAAESERDRLVSEVEVKNCEVADLASRMAAVEKERDDLSAELEAKRSEVDGFGKRLKVAEESSHEWRERHAAEQSRVADVTADLQNQIQRYERLTLEHADLDRKLKSSVKDSERRLRAVEKDADRFEARFQEAKAELECAHEAAAVGEEKLADRFKELAALTALLQEQELRNQEARERLRWLAALDEQVRAQPSWWNFMPASWRRKREQDGLKRAGLFDGEAYLAANPDVAAEQYDPLRHYVIHGIHENRRRG